MEIPLDLVKTAVREALEEVLGCGDYRIATRWQGGKLIFQPFDSAHQHKEVPINAFFKKITSVREKLRILEQKINNHLNLSQEDKVELQQLITRSYGSLTTFNFLFRDEGDKFAGVREED